MNINLFETIQLTEILIIVGIIAIVLVVLAVLIFGRRKPKKTNLDEALLNRLVLALGSDQNIMSVNLEQQRIQIKVKDTKLINQDFFKDEKIPAFISGTKITVLFKEHAKEISQFLASKGA